MNAGESDPPKAATRLLSRRQKAAFALVAMTFALLVIEWVARGTEKAAGRPRTFQPERFHGFGQTDPVLWWKLQPNLKTEAQGVEIQTNAWGLRDAREEYPQEGFTILCVGDSTTYGWRVPAEAMFTAVCERELRRRAKVPVVVVSAGVPGYTSYQCLEMLRLLLPEIRPDAVVVLASNNECRRRPMGDRERGARLARARTLDAWLGWSALWRLLRGSPPSLRNEFESKTDAGRVANTPEEYEANLFEMARLVRQHGCHLTFMTVPIRYFQSPSWRMPEAVPADVRTLLDRVDRMRLRGEDPSARVTLLRRAVDDTPTLAVIHYALAEALREAGPLDQAYRTAEQARELDPHPETAKPSYNNVVRRVAAQVAALVVDLDRHFRDSGKPEHELFLDHCHPSPAGHEFIGRALADALLPVVGKAAGRTP